MIFQTRPNDLLKQFLDIRKDLCESTRCCYNNLYKKHVEPVLGGRQVNKVKPTEIQKLYQEMVNDTGVNPTAAQKTHCFKTIWQDSEPIYGTAWYRDADRGSARAKMVRL